MRFRKALIAMTGAAVLAWTPAQAFEAGAAGWAQQPGILLGGVSAEGPPPGTGQLIITLDPAAFGGTAERFGALIAAIETQPGARAPGSRRLALRRKAAREGLVVSDALLKEIALLSDANS